MQIRVYMERWDLMVGIWGSRQRLSAIQNATFRLESWELTTFPFPLSRSEWLCAVSDLKAAWAGHMGSPEGWTLLMRQLRALPGPFNLNHLSWRPLSEIWALSRTRGPNTGCIATFSCKSCFLVSPRAVACSDSSFVVSKTKKCVNVKHSLVNFRYLLMECVLLKQTLISNSGSRHWISQLFIP